MFSVKKISSSNLALYLSVALYAIYIFLVNWTAAANATANAGWAVSLFASLANLVLAVCCLAVIYKIAKDIGVYAKRKFYTLGAIAVMAFLAFTLQSISIFLPLVIGFAAAGSSNRKIAKIIATSFSLLLLTSFIFYLFGLNGGDVISKPLFGDDDYHAITVPALGMSNPNGVMMIFTGIIISSLYLCNTKRQTRNASMVLVVLAVILSVTTGSTTGLMIGLLAIVLIWFAKYGKKAPSRLQRAALWMFVAVTIITFAVAILFGPRESLPNPVNDILTTRPYTWNLRIENQSYLNVYGDNDQYASEPTGASGRVPYALDNMILFILVKYGIIAYLMFLYIFYNGSKRIKEPVILVFVVIACLLMFAERMYLYSIVLIFLQKAIVEYELKERKVSKRRLHGSE